MQKNRVKRRKNRVKKEENGVKKTEKWGEIGACLTVSEHSFASSGNNKK